MSIYPPADVTRAVQQREAEMPRARVAAVAPDSPADDAGFEPGCYVTGVDGQPVRDIIDWRWLSSEEVITLDYIDLDGDAGTVDLEREEGEGWGFDFEGMVFDGVKQCKNACIFCFMHQLPQHMRPSLTLRDDDFRLSFLAGTFVTFTNLTSEDEQRIAEQHISPLRVSLHATDPDVRHRMIGRQASRGLEVLERLLAAGIEFHAQIVLVPGENDGDVLADTLAWAYARPGILDVCIVPLGFTKYQSRFTHSFGDPIAARAVMDRIEPFQQRALTERGTPWAFAADEFYTCAYGTTLRENVPPAPFYGDFDMFEDGVGIIRSFIDDWEEAEHAGLMDRAAAALEQAELRVRYVAGYATCEFLGPLVARSIIAPFFEPLFVQNDFFGGNVDVTGLLCGVDIIEAIRICEGGAPGSTQSFGSPDSHGQPTGLSGSCGTRLVGTSRCSDGLSHRNSKTLYVIPRVVFNDDNVTLDDMTLEDMENATGARMSVVSCNASDFLREIIELAGR